MARCQAGNPGINFLSPELSQDSPNSPRDFCIRDCAEPHASPAKSLYQSSNVNSYLQSSYPLSVIPAKYVPRRRGAGIQKPNQASPQSCAGSYVYMVGPIMFGFPPARLCKNPTPVRVACGKLLRICAVYWIPAFEAVQETLTRSRYLWKSRAGWCGLLDSCFRDCARNPRQAALSVENLCRFECFAGFLLSQE